VSAADAFSSTCTRRAGIASSAASTLAGSDGASGLAADIPVRDYAMRDYSRFLHSARQHGATY
jgi:hypothetical protein